jgi:hypothetical protein
MADRRMRITVLLNGEAANPRSGDEPIASVILCSHIKELKSTAHQCRGRIHLVADRAASEGSARARLRRAYGLSLIDRKGEVAGSGLDDPPTLCAHVGRLWFSQAIVVARLCYWRQCRESNRERPNNDGSRVRMADSGVPCGAMTIVDSLSSTRQPG